MTLSVADKYLITDLYELTMAQSYYFEGMGSDAVFSLFIRDYPPNRGYFVNAGLEDVLNYLENLTFSQTDLEYLDSTGLFRADFLHYLSSLRFTGDVFAMPEGRIFFKEEPVLEITAPIIQGQLAETYIINRFNFQVAAATKFSRSVSAAQGRQVVDFSLRRTQGIDAGMAVARSGWIAGMDATSNVMAGNKYGIPVSGTMAHSYVTAFKSELDSFRAYADLYKNETVLLIDTYDTMKGAEKAADVAREMAEKGYRLKAVRLDSGDMVQLSRQVRNLFDSQGLDYVKIFASGGFDEYSIADCLDRGAAIDGFGVGTRPGVSADAPYTDMAYKMVHYNGRSTLKLSSGKRSLAAPKQVFRNTINKRMEGDVIGLRQESLSGKPLLMPVMTSGERAQKSEPLQTVRERFRSDLDALPERYRKLKSPDEYPVETSDALERLQEEAVKTVTRHEMGGPDGNRIERSFS
ncbi:MAG: nicotinate phosphoribosyltransferase [Thermodesulfobacteriota bacterium]